MLLNITSTGELFLVVSTSMTLHDPEPQKGGLVTFLRFLLLLNFTYRTSRIGLLSINSTLALLSNCSNVNLSTSIIHCVSKKTGPLLPFAITPTVLVQQQQILTKIIVRESLNSMCYFARNFKNRVPAEVFLAPTVKATALQYSNKPTTSVTKSLNVIMPTFEQTVDQQHHSQKLQQMFKVLSFTRTQARRRLLHSSIASSTTICCRPDQTSTKRCFSSSTAGTPFYEIS